MSDVSRMTRVNELLKRELADVIRKNVNYSSSYLVSVSEVQTNPNLRAANVFISILGANTDEEKMELLTAINNKKAIIQKVMSSHVTLKYTPVLKFKLDDRIEKGDNVLAMIQKLEEGNL